MRSIVRAPRAPIGVGEPSRHTPRAPSLHQKLNAAREAVELVFVRRRRHTANHAAIHELRFGARTTKEPLFLAIEQRDLPAHRCAQPLLEPQIELIGTLRRSIRQPQRADDLLEFGELTIDAGPASNR